MLADQGRLLSTSLHSPRTDTVLYFMIPVESPDGRLNLAYDIEIYVDRCAI